MVSIKTDIVPMRGMREAPSKERGVRSAVEVLYCRLLNNARHIVCRDQTTFDQLAMPTRADADADWPGSFGPEGKRRRRLETQEPVAHPQETQETCNSKLIILRGGG